MKEKVKKRKVFYQVFTLLLDETSTHSPAFKKNHEKKKSREENQEKKTVEVGSV